MLPPFLRLIFRVLNKYFMVPLYRIGLGIVFGNPIWGYMMVIKSIGRKSGRIRYSPVNYAIEKGNIYCIAGWGNMADWYKNIKSNQEIEVILPNMALAGNAEEVFSAEERIPALRRVLKAGGLASLFMGINPYTITDVNLETKTKNIPVIRIRPKGIGTWASDYGGWLWIAVIVIIVLMGIRK